MIKSIFALLFLLLGCTVPFVTPTDVTVPVARDATLIFSSVGCPTDCANYTYGNQTSLLTGMNTCMWTRACAHVHANGCIHMHTHANAHARTSTHMHTQSQSDTFVL